MMLGAVVLLVALAQGADHLVFFKPMHVVPDKLAPGVDRYTCGGEQITITSVVQGDVIRITSVALAGASAPSADIDEINRQLHQPLTQVTGVDCGEAEGIPPEFFLTATQYDNTWTVFSVRAHQIEVNRRGYNGRP